MQCGNLRNTHNASNPMFGHCYHSSQALFHLMDTNVLEQRTAVDYHDCSHWWLVDKTTDKIYDITADQYYHVGQTPPYVDGKKMRDRARVHIFELWKLNVTTEFLNSIKNIKIRLKIFLYFSIPK